MGSPFAPNEVPAPVCAAALSGSPTESVRSWHGITFRRLMKDSRFSMKKAGRSADTTSLLLSSTKNNTLRLFSQQLKTNFGRFEQLHKILFVKRKIPPTQRSDGSCRGETDGKMNRVCCGAVNSSWTFPHGSGGSHGDNQPLSVAVFKMNTTTSCGWFQTNPQNQ